jgi:hypothetical protein
MRSIKELLQITLENQKYFYSGLCGFVSGLQYSDKITWEERRLLLNYITDNRPSKWSSLSAFRSRNSAYYWKETDIKPRIKWIKKHIKLNS